MSSDVALACHGVSKRYLLGVTSGFSSRDGAWQRQRTTMFDAMVNRAKLGRRAKRPEFWALRDVDLELEEGQVLGLVGRNGAGKSTLLKLITRITDLSEGRIDLYGRVGALLEVATGFHPELTGKENIYLNGAILGMRTREIDRELDAIVEFSGVEKFLTTPIKRYSSGMAVRLAFSIAAHLRTEILLVDEVLSVGDRAFREKCLGKLGTVAESGRTVIYVSHLMETVTGLCTQAVLLEHGQITRRGSANDVVGYYLTQQSVATDLTADIERRPGMGAYRFTEAEPDADLFSAHEEKVVHFTIAKQNDSYHGRMFVSAVVVDERENVVAHCDSRLVNYDIFEDKAVHHGTLRLRSPWLRPGRYRVDLRLLANRQLIDDAQGACWLEVAPITPYPGSVGKNDVELGNVMPEFTFAEQPSTNGAAGDTEGAHIDLN